MVSLQTVSEVCCIVFGGLTVPGSLYGAVLLWKHWKDNDPGGAMSRIVKIVGLVSLLLFGTASLITGRMILLRKPPTANVAGPGISSSPLASTPLSPTPVRSVPAGIPNKVMPALPIRTKTASDSRSQSVPLQSKESQQGVGDINVGTNMGNVAGINNGTQQTNYGVPQPPPNILALKITPIEPQVLQAGIACGFVMCDKPGQDISFTLDRAFSQPAVVIMADKPCLISDVVAFTPHQAFISMTPNETPFTVKDYVNVAEHILSLPAPYFRAWRLL